MTDKIDAADFSEMVFNTLQDSSTSLAIRPPESPFPWEGHSEDHTAVEDWLKHVYERLNLKPPRFAWAPSPAAMYTAINMLRAVQTGQRHKFIEGLVVADDPIASAKRTLLDAIIDQTVTTTTGQAVKPMIHWPPIWSNLWLTDLSRFLGAHNFQPMHQAKLRGPNVNEVTLYSALYMECIGATRCQTLCFVPYVHICWLCRPPVEATLYEDGHLAMMRFADGYTINLPPTPKTEDEYHVDELPATELPALPPGAPDDDDGA